MSFDPDNWNQLCTAEELCKSSIWSDSIRPEYHQINDWTVDRKIPCCKISNERFYSPQAVYDALKCQIEPLPYEVIKARAQAKRKAQEAKRKMKQRGKAKAA